MRSDLQKRIQKRIQKKRRRNLRKDPRLLLAQNFLRVVISVAATLVVAMVIWHFAKPYARRIEWREAEQVEETTSSGPITFLPQYENGSGQAGIALRLDEMKVNFDTPGWQRNSKGWWYACDTETCYANGWVDLDGQRYHFDKNGYMSAGGWVPIGGTGYYFDENGIWQREMDSSRMIALTFDDGPGPFTSQLLDILEENNATASFMMLGEMVEENGDGIIQRMVDLGCSIGNHSYDHPNMLQIDTAEAKRQFQLTDEAIAKYNNGKPASVIRFPYGNYNEELAELTGRPCYYWNLDSDDWNNYSAQGVCDTILSQVEGGSIILMHDTLEQTLEACRIAIPALVEQGWQLVNLETLTAARGYDLEGGVTYYGFTDREIANGVATDKN